MELIDAARIVFPDGETLQKKMDRIESALASEAQTVEIEEDMQA